MIRKVALFFLFIPFLVISQKANDAIIGDAKYLEDQVYVGVNYNFMLSKPIDVLQRNFSYGLQGGVIRDVPLNKKRTVALGIGLGYAVNSYYSNLISDNSNGAIVYAVPSSDSLYNRSKIETHSIELPIEFRWRNSSPTDYKFLRIYTGVKFGYNFSARSKLVADSGRTGFKNDDIQKLQYGLTLNMGYNTFNLHVYYSLSDFIKKDTFIDTGEKFEIKPIRIGLIFYIL
tara:strand:+ start:48498 stop:49187 length:690 start_codon:yes stop_codon:yes gene_type:complete